MFVNHESLNIFFDWEGQKVWVLVEKVQAQVLRVFSDFDTCIEMLLISHLPILSPTFAPSVP